jgi:hypothetical protein
MIVSMNELDSMTRKAFRGAGYYWGEAEEAGKAATWLACRGFAVLGPVLHLLHEAQMRLPAMRPMKEGHIIRAEGGLLCPVLAGIALSDDAGELRAGQEMHYGGLCAPLLVVPFLSATAAAAPLRLVFHSHAGTVEAFGNQCAVHMSPVSAEVGSASLQALAPVTLAGGTISVTDHALNVEAAQWEALSAFGARTHVPASARSRLSGAGAGLQDED